MSEGAGAGTGTGTGASNATRRSRPRRRPDNRNKKQQPEGAASTEKPTKKNNRNQKRSTAKSTKKKDVRHDYRYLEIVKLMKFYKPLTINGVSVKSIIEKAEEAAKMEEATKVEEKETTNEEVLDETDSNIEEEKTKETIKKSHKTTTLPPNALHNHIAKLITEGSPIYLLLMFKPADPDFPYDLDMLRLSLCVPPKYPYDTLIQPSVFVLNDDIPRGFAVNIEIGFRDITMLALGRTQQDPEAEESIQLAKGRGLLSQIQTLDRNLEYFLKQERKETIKIVKKKKKTKSENVSENSSPAPQSPKPVTTTPTPPKQIHKPIPLMNPERQALLDDMISKLPCKLFSKNNIENVYRMELPAVITHNTSPPTAWVNNKVLDVRLHIPVEYPQERAWISVPAQMLNKISRMPAPDTCTPTELADSAQKALKERLLLVKAAKLLEKNFRNIPDYLKSAHGNLVTLLNFASTHLGVLCLEEKECRSVITMLSS